MPPKPKNTREEIAAAAFDIVKQEGLSALTEKNVGQRLNSSASSIFTVLPSMEAADCRRGADLYEYTAYRTGSQH